MNYLFIVVTAFVLFSNTVTRAQTPNKDELTKQKETQIKYLVEQIIALKAYLETAKKGYDIARNGLKLIGDIKEGNFNLHKDYFYSLDVVKPVIGSSSKVSEIINLRNLLVNEINELLTDCESDENFSLEEIHYLSGVQENLQRLSDAAIEDLEKTLTDDELQMKDNERFERIDDIYNEMKNMFAFTRQFANSTRLLSLQRAKQRNEVATSEKLLQNP